MLTLAAVARDEIETAYREHSCLTWTRTRLEPDAQLVRILRRKDFQEFFLPMIRLEFEFLEREGVRILAPATQLVGSDSQSAHADIAALDKKVCVAPTFERYRR